MAQTVSLLLRGETMSPGVPLKTGTKWKIGSYIATYFIFATIGLIMKLQTTPTSMIPVRKFPTFQNYASVSHRMYPGNAETLVNVMKLTVRKITLVTYVTTLS